ncbi:MAG: hypothetical protein LLG01_09085 [Planctomycetaceae bacterium]|nr:hypothetical protein [Planctomycetaceae bacterium]
MPERPKSSQPAASPAVSPVTSSVEVGGAGCLIRLAWMLAGPAALAICFVEIAQDQGLSSADAIFWIVAGIMAWLKRVDIMKMHGRTADGRPANWKKYLMILAGVCLALWAVAHAIAWYRG